MAQYKRRITLIKPRFQLKLVSIFLCLAASCILLQFAMLHLSMTDLAAASGQDNPKFTNQVTSVLWTHLVLTLGLLVPLTILVGILVTFRIAGPVYRMERHCEAIARGERPGPCRVRQGDEFQGLCDLLNQAVANLGGCPTADEVSETDTADSEGSAQESQSESPTAG